MRFVIFCVCVVTFFSGTHAQAYDITSRVVYDLENHYTLYLLGFSLGFLTHDTIVGTSTLRVATSSPTSRLGYALENDRGLTLTKGYAAATLLSAASSTKDGYYIPRGENATFTLAVLYQGTASSTSSALELRHLPMTLINKQAKRSGYYFSQAELTPFRTDRHASSTTIVTN